MKTLSLDGRWLLRQDDQEDAITASVPGTVHEDLLRAGRIEDPFYRDNELRVQWVGHSDWTYSRIFRVPAALLRARRVLLRCEGLDTLARLRLNGRELGCADNMFRVWEFDVKALLQAGDNTIEVRLSAPARYAEKKARQRALPQWIGPLDQRGGNWLRKQPCNFGWDWGVCLVTCGIWRSISLVAFESRLVDVQVLQEHARERVDLQVNVRSEAAAGAALRARVRVCLDGREVAAAEAGLRRGTGKVKLRVAQPQLWWPNGMGGQPLYQVEVDLVDAQGAVVDSWERRIGLRTLRLDRHADEWGESFQFTANGVPFFAKGANWIPADAILSRMTPARYRQLVQDTAAANMNMLRVWGGGLYEDESFYAACDEMGVCVWQDFIFSCAAYPTFDRAFVANVRAEAEDNVRRLRHHACIALWCGNNELEQGLVGDQWTERTMSWKDYSRLFDQLLPQIVQALDPQRDYWPGSPHTPQGDRMNSNDPTCGDAHLWSVWHGRQPFEWYRTCQHRFNSEFGFQSFPEPRTVRGYTRPEDRNVTSFVMEHHQRSGIGNTTILAYMLDWFRLPGDFDMVLWASQILQGMAMKYAVEHWRRQMPRGMGTLYWQLNDCWPVASWSSIDYHGRWKALHYMARRFNAPLLISGVEDLSRRTVEVHVTSDLQEEARAEVRWVLTRVDGSRVEAGCCAVTVPPRRSALVRTLQLGPQVERQGPRDVLLWLELAQGRRVVSTNLVTLARPKHLELQTPRISTRVETLGEQAYRVTLDTDRPALWAWLELEGAQARYSENFVHLRPGRPVVVDVTPARRIGLAQLRRKLAVRSLIDTYAG